jgi:two-component system phosphate regulon response regulator PhoB
MLGTGIEDPSMSRHVIVVEDEGDLADLIALHLRRENFRVSVYGDGDTGMAAIERDRPDLVVLDLMLPGLDGLEICRRIRRSESLGETPVLMLTARAEESDVITGLEVGADDYVPKPFSPRVLVARIRSLLRRGERAGAGSEVLRVGDLEVDSGRHEVRVADEVIALTHTEFRILRYLAGGPGRVRTRADILRAIDETSVLERTVDVHVGSMRKKLGASGEMIETVRGVGYRIEEP